MLTKLGSLRNEEQFALHLFWSCDVCALRARMSNMIAYSREIVSVTPYLGVTLTANAHERNICILDIFHSSMATLLGGTSEHTHVR